MHVFWITLLGETIAQLLEEIVERTHVSQDSNRFPSQVIRCQCWSHFVTRLVKAMFAWPKRMDYLNIPSTENVGDMVN